MLTTLLLVGGSSSYLWAPSTRAALPCRYGRGPMALAEPMAPMAPAAPAIERLDVLGAKTAALSTKVLAGGDAAAQVAELARNQPTRLIRKAQLLAGSAAVTEAGSGVFPAEGGFESSPQTSPLDPSESTPPERLQGKLFTKFQRSYSFPDSVQPEIRQLQPEARDARSDARSEARSEARAAELERAQELRARMQQRAIQLATPPTQNPEAAAKAAALKEAQKEARAQEKEAQKAARALERQVRTEQTMLQRAASPRAAPPPSAAAESLSRDDGTGATAMEGAAAASVAAALLERLRLSTQDGVGISPEWLLGALGATLLLGRESQRQALIDEATEVIQQELVVEQSKLAAEMAARSNLEAELANATAALQEAAAVERTIRQAAADAAAIAAAAREPFAAVEGEEEREVRRLEEAAVARKLETEAALEKVIALARPTSERLQQIESELKPLAIKVERADREGGMAQLSTVGARLKVTQLEYERVSELERLKQLSARQKQLDEQSDAEALQIELQIQKARLTAATQREELRTAERLQTIASASVAAKVLAPIVEALERAASHTPSAEKPADAESSGESS